MNASRCYGGKVLPPVFLVAIAPLWAPQACKFTFQVWICKEMLVLLKSRSSAPAGGF